MTLDKIQAVKQVSETLSTQSVSGGEVREVAAPSAERFQSFMNSGQSLKPPSFEWVEPGALITEIQQTEDLQKNSIFSEEKVSTQRNGSATDQENKKGRQQSEIEEIESTAPAKSQRTSSNSSSLIDQVGKGLEESLSAQLTPETIKAQTQGIIAQLDGVKKQIQQAPNEIKPSYQALLRNRLTHIDDNLKIALNKAGIEYTPLSAAPSSTRGTHSNPLHRFLDMVSHGQRQLENFQQEVDKLSSSSESRLTFPQMLTIQLKMNYVQQEIELFTSLLNKALESTKTIMNVQV